MYRKFNIILDTDIGTDIDDAYALALAMRAPNLNILGVSTVTGNTMERAKIVKKMLLTDGKESIPIFAGKESKSPLTYETWANDTNQEGISSSMEEMVEFYWKMLESKKNAPLHVVAIGPLTNIKLVRDLDPELFDEKVDLLIMGGAIKKGYLGRLNVLPEFNIYYDRDAAKAIFNSQIRLTMVPLDVTMDLKITKTHMDHLMKMEDQDALLSGLLGMTSTFRKHLLGRRPLIMFDPATIATLIDNSLAKFTELPIKITNRGFTRVIKVEGSNSKPMVGFKEVCLDFNKEKFFELFLSIFSS